VLNLKDIFYCLYAHSMSYTTVLEYADARFAFAFVKERGNRHGINALCLHVISLVLDITRLLLYVIITDLYDHTTILPIIGQYNHRQS